MPMTVTSSTSAYCTPAQAIQMFDVTMWGDLLQDTGTRLTSGQVLTDLNLAAELLIASGEVEQKALKGERYQPADLAALQSPMTAGGWILAKIVASIAMRNCLERRDPFSAMPPAILRAYDMLDELIQGQAIFGFAETQEAGLPSTKPFYSDITDAQRSPVFKARRLFGTHQNELIEF